MAWSDAARRAAAEARKRRAGLFKHYPADWRKKEAAFQRRLKLTDQKLAAKERRTVNRGALLERASNYTGDSRRQGAAIKKLGSQGYHPKTGKYVGKRKAGAAARRLGDMANE